MKRGASFALALVLIAVAARSAAADERAAWSGAGTMTCAGVSEALKEHPDDENLFFSWAQGFMSGLNTPLLKHGETDLNSESMSEQKQFIKAYCRDHPRSNYFEPVFKLYEKMRHDQGLPSYVEHWQEPKSK